MNAKPENLFVEPADDAAIDGWQCAQAEAQKEARNIKADLERPSAEERERRAVQRAFAAEVNRPDELTRAMWGGA